MNKITATKAVKKRRKYDDAYKQQALQLIRLGQTVPAVAQALGISRAALVARLRALGHLVVAARHPDFPARLQVVERQVNGAAAIVA